MNAPTSALLWSLVILALPAASADPGDSTNPLRQAKQWNAEAETYMDRGAYDDARRLYLRSLPVMEQILGPEHPASVTILGNLCDASIRMSAYLDAKPVCTRALALREKVLGPNHPDVARSLSDLALLYANEGNLARAEALLRRALAINRAENSPDLPALLNNLGFLYAQKRKYSLAEDVFDRAIASTEKSRGPDDPDLVTMLSNAGYVYLQHRRFHAAEDRFQHGLAIAEHASVPETERARALVGLARAEAAVGNASQAAAFLQRAEGVVERDHQAYLELGPTIELARRDLLGR